MAGAGEGVVAGTQPGASSWLGRMPGWHTGPGMTAAAMSRRVEPPDAPPAAGKGRQKPYQPSRADRR